MESEELSDGSGRGQGGEFLFLWPQFGNKCSFGKKKKKNSMDRGTWQSMGSQTVGHD